MASVITRTVTKTVASLAPSGTVRAAPQGGILEGGNPSNYDPKNPIIMFIIQAGIILVFCRLLHYPLSKLRQPRVIAEVIGGILLGPSVMGRIPGFKDAIFPTASMPNLTLVANIGLILFLFLVGLEVDLRFLISNWRVAFSVSAAGMTLPFGLGCGIAWGLYHQFRDDSGLAPITFGTYMLFIGVAMAITAFPVLCRILTELKLLNTPVGVIVLSAGVGNDVVGWILLALCVALVNAGSGITALWVLLTALGYALFLAYAIRPAFLLLLNRTGSLQSGPTQAIVALTLGLALTSAFFTGIIGVHPIFGAFMVGLICPHEGGFAIKVTEKVEDLVSVLFLPLYFALSGLSTNLGLLNTGITWGYVVGVIAIAFVGKVAGGTLASRLNGLVWRESFTIGVLMSCKGLVELIVLNIGLQAKILSQRTFTIFVVMALVTTFATTPLTLLLYPKWYQTKLTAWKRGEIDWDGNPLKPDDSNDGVLSLDQKSNGYVKKLLVYLRFDNLPGLFTFISLLGAGTLESPPPMVHHLNENAKPNERKGTMNQQARQKRPLEVHGVRLMELTERDSSVMKVTEVDEWTHKDPVVNTFRTFGLLNNVAVSGGVAVVPEHSYADTLIGKAADVASDLVLIPWSETGSMSEHHTLLPHAFADKFAQGTHSTFISTVLRNSNGINIGIFVNRGFGGGLSLESPESRALARTISGLSMRSLRDTARAPVANPTHHIFFPFFGGADDRFALRFVLQLAQNENVTATILHVEALNQEHTSGEPSGSSVEIQPKAASSTRRSFGLPSKSKEANTETRVTMANPHRDNPDNIFLSSLQDSLPPALTNRVVFQFLTTGSGENPLSAALERAKEELGLDPRNAGDLIVVGRSSVRSGHMGDGGFSERIGFEAKKALGAMGAAVVKDSSVKGSLLVLQARSEES